jgi:phage tail sheath protein FI
MSTYMTPGVYVEEVPARNKPIEGVSTSIAAFIGMAPWGPLNRPVLISDWSQFERTYSDPEHPKAGPYMEGAYLAYAVRGFFANQGTQCWVVRVGGIGQPRAVLPAEKDRKKTPVLEATARPEVEADVKLELTLDPPALNAHNDTDPKQASAKQTGTKQTGTKQGDAEQSGAQGADADEAAQPPPPTYTLVLTAKGAATEKYSGLAPSELAAKVNEQSKLIELTPQAGGGDLLPAAATYCLSAPAKPAQDVSAEEVEGSSAKHHGLLGLEAIEDISMVCVPDLMAIAKTDTELRDLQGKVIEHCEKMADRVALLDTPRDKIPADVLDWRLNAAGYDSKQATLYYPWLEVMDRLSGFPKLVPPCGHVAGVWARTDKTRGVHKAPANEAIMEITGLGFHITDVEQGELNRSGLNCIRPFQGRGIRVWGARTLSYDPEWRYLNVRRLFNFISDSIMRGTQWAVFEPNDERLWIQLQIAVSNFLTIAWRNGALFGATPEEAFYVKCDRETNPPESIDAGQVVTEVGIAPVKPAEFVVFRINQYTAGEGAA